VSIGNENLVAGLNTRIKNLVKALSDQQIRHDQQVKKLKEQQLSSDELDRIIELILDDAARDAIHHRVTKPKNRDLYARLVQLRVDLYGVRS